MTKMEKALRDCENSGWDLLRAQIPPEMRSLSLEEEKWFFDKGWDAGRAFAAEEIRAQEEKTEQLRKDLTEHP